MKLPRDELLKAKQTQKRFLVDKFVLKNESDDVSRFAGSAVENIRHKYYNIKRGYSKYLGILRF